MSTLENIIRNRLSEIEAKYDVRILFAAESGSRAWGFASPDSDYDIRMVYIHRREWYLSLYPGKDVIEEMDPDGLLDISGWDIRKALTLLGKGNCALYEWISSPIVYLKDEEFFRGISSLKERYFRRVSAINHYYHLAVNHDKRYIEKRGGELKRFLYHLRGLLAAKWIGKKGTFPPVLFSDLVEGMVSDPSVKDGIGEMIRLKSGSREHDQVIVGEDLIRYSASLSSEVLSLIGTLPPEEHVPFAALDEFFLNMLEKSAVK